MNTIRTLVTEHLDIWTAAETEKKSGRGRSSGNATSVYGIKKLRELILELAVRGKLVPQDASDEPASVLLEKIVNEKARLIKEGKIKNQKSLPEISDEARMFELPVGWKWIRLGSLGVSNTGKTPSTGNTKYFGGEIPFLGPGQISLDGELLDADKTLTEEGSVYSSIASPGDILMVCIGGSIGKSAIAKSRVAFNQQINCISPLLIDSTFLNSAMSAPHFQTAILEAATGSATPIINRSKWEELLIPLPPLDEQHRIVAKVDELMALCDQLEQQQTDSNTAHQTLVEILLGTLTNSADKNEFATAWRRIADHFDTLFTTRHSIDQLKQIILQLAVMGKLVPQNSSDEPASVLLKKIAEEKQRLVKDGEVKKQEPLPIITDEEKGFELLEGWEFVRLGEITNKIGSGSTPRGGERAYAKSGTPFLRSQNIWNHGLEINDVAYISDETHKKMSNTVVIPNDILLNITGASLGRCAVFPEGVGEANVSQHVTIIRPTMSRTRDYLHYCILSPYIQNFVWGRQVGMAREGLSKKVLELFEIPLPPLDEQHRIVAKVDELMALCDALKARLNQVQTIQIHLADAIVEQAVA